MRRNFVAVHSLRFFVNKRAQRIPLCKNAKLVFPNGAPFLGRHSVVKDTFRMVEIET